MPSVTITDVTLNVWHRKAAQRSRTERAGGHDAERGRERPTWGPVSSTSDGSPGEDERRDREVDAVDQHDECLSRGGQPEQRREHERRVEARRAS